MTTSSTFARIAVLVLGGVASLCGGLAACSGGSGTTTGGDSEGAFAKSACGKCVATSCGAEITACGSDAGCAAYLACLDACSPGSSGDADATCVAKCPVGTSQGTLETLADVNACRSVGPGAMCKACGVPSNPKLTAPVLNDSCPSTSTETNPCYVCEDEHCCMSSLACAGDMDCVALEQCLGSCNGGAPCIQMCTMQHAVGANVFGPYFACGSVRCAADQAECDPTERDVCEQCVFSTCSDPFAYFLSTQGGYALLACVESCGSDASCEDACYTSFPTAFVKYVDYAACIAEGCKGQC
jgi:hypothetical protein